MAIVPAGYPIGLQDAGANPTVTQAPTLTEMNITKGTTSFNTLQSWTEIAYSPFSSTYYTRYIKNLTGGWLHGYSLATQYSSGLYSGSIALGPTARGMMLDSGAPGSSSSSQFGPSTTYHGSPWSSYRSKIFESTSSTYGGIPASGGTGVSGQLPETLHQTYSYQGLITHGQDFAISTSSSIGSVSNSSDLDFTSPDGNSDWRVIQFIGGENVYTSGNFPNKNGPYYGNNRTSDNIGNFIYMALYRTTGHLTDAQAAAVDADDIFSHIQISGTTLVLTSGLTGVSHSSGLTGIAPATGNRVWGQYTSNVNQVIGFLWSGLSDSQVETFMNYTGSSLNVKIMGPQASTTYNNGVAEEHGGADSADVKISDYIKGGTYVGAGNSAASIASTLTDVAISDYQDTEEDGAGSSSGGVFVDSDTNADYYPYKGAGIYGSSVDYVYGTGLVASPAYGAFVPSTTAARTFTINGTNQVIIEASIAYATPNGTNFICRFYPASGSSSDLLTTSEWSTITLTKTNNTSHSNTLSLTSSSSGYGYTSATTAATSGHIVPQATLSFMTNSPSTTNNYIYNWITDNGTKTGTQDFTINIT